jgi:drebrin-like protein
VAWCGGGVPERTKGYFTSHTAAVSKILHGYHVQITARSDSDLEPASIIQKVADASGAKYSAGSSASAPAPPPVKSKPVFTPTNSSAGRYVNPIVAARSKRDDNVDEDGWGADAPPVTRTQIEKVESAYKPTKVNINQLTQQKQEPRIITPAKQDNADEDVVRGGYQPIGKVDIAAIRAQAQYKADDRPSTVKGAYEPVGKVDIAAIRAKAQKPAGDVPSPANEPEESKPLADRAAAFSQPAQSERLTTLPKPKVANKFGGASTFTGTKAPTPGGLGFGQPAPAKAAPVGTASRTFADQGGKTPAQLWAEKKARERGESVGSSAAPQTPEAPVTVQKSGEGWKSGYSGKSWAPVQTSSYGRPSNDPISAENTGENTRDAGEASDAPSGGFSALKDRFKDTAPIGSAPPPPATRAIEDEAPAPPVPDSSRPSGGFALPGLPSRPPPAAEEEEEEDPSAYEPINERESSPVRIAIPVSRGAELPVEEEQPIPPPLPPTQIDVPKEDDLPDEQEQVQAARAAATAVAEQTFEPEAVAGDAQGQGGHRAVVQYDYEKAEENEIELVEGQIITEIDMVDDDWWLGTDPKGERGLFPSNYVEIVEESGGADAAPAAEPTPPPAPAPVPAPPPPAAAPAPASKGATATALYDYEAAEDNGNVKILLTIRDGANFEL